MNENVIDEKINEIIKNLEESYVPNYYIKNMRNSLNNIKKCVKEHPERVVKNVKVINKELQCLCNGKKFFKTALINEVWDEEFGQNYSGHDYICLNCLEHYYSEIYDTFYDI